MPTFNQLVRQGRSDKVYKSKTPVLQTGFNTSCLLALAYKHLSLKKEERNANL